jgi:hypothetical protein
MLRRVLFACLIFLSFSHGAPAQIVISEVMFDPSGPENTDEFVEICNLSLDETVDLQGWRLGDGTGDDPVKDAGKGLFLGPGRYAVILDGDYFGQSTSYDSLIPSDALVLTVEGSTLGSAGLSNSKSENITIYDAEGLVVDEYSYHIGNKSGYSDERIDLTLPNTPDNWADSRVPLGTPGFKNSAARAQVNLKVLHLYYDGATSIKRLVASLVNDGKSAASGFSVQFYTDFDLDFVLDADEAMGSALAGNTVQPGDSAVFSVFWDAQPGVNGVGFRLFFNGDEKPEDDFMYRRIYVEFPAGAMLINEIMYDPIMGESEWIEIYNPMPVAANLACWMLSDQDTLRRYQVDMNPFSVPSGGYTMLTEDSSFLKRYPALENQTLILSGFPNFNNDSDAVVLYDPSGRKMDLVAYSSKWGGGKGVSLERIDFRMPSNDRYNWGSCQATDGSTPGIQNSLYYDVKIGGGSFSVQPNPFSPDGDGMDDTAILSYKLPFETAFIQLRIFDIRGRVVRHLERGRLLEKGGRFLWDGKDDQSRPVPIGQYVAFLEAAAQKGGKTESYRAVLVLAGSL